MILRTIHIILALLSVIGFIIGSYIGWIGYKAYKSNNDVNLLYICTGFFIIAISNLFEEAIILVCGYEIEHAHAVRIPLFLIGMIMILFSLKYTKKIL
jgi:hypothetical protein